MSVEMSVWRIDSGLKPIEFAALDLESRLEDLLCDHIDMISPVWLVIGRQVRTDHGGLIDLLALDRDANLIVIELKRDKTPREVVAQLLDYGSWVCDLTSDQIAQIFSDFQARQHPGRKSVSLDEAFREKFKLDLPDEINVDHELVIVASHLDASTERIVRYLADQHAVRINAVFFRFFRDDDREFLCRAWLRDPVDVTAGFQGESARGEWNGEYYVSFGYPMEWVKDGLKRGYIAAGGGSWYSKTLANLSPGDRIWVNIPNQGYIGVARVEDTVKAIDDFMVKDDVGNLVPLIDVLPDTVNVSKAADDPETADYLVRVSWLHKVDPERPIREKGFFGNQNTVAKPVSLKWHHTVDRLKRHFGISD